MKLSEIKALGLNYPFEVPDIHSLDSKKQIHSPASFIGWKNHFIDTLGDTVVSIDNGKPIVEINNKYRD